MTTTNLTDVDEFVTIPVPASPGGTHGDARTAWQKLANRTFYLYQRAITEGVKRGRTVENTAALKAIANPADNEMALVEQSGLYLLDIGSSAAEALPWIVQPTTGSGRWFHILNALRNVPQGFPTLDAAGMIANTQTHNRIKEIDRYFNSAFTQNILAGSAWTTLAGVTVTLDALANTDIVVVTASFGKVGSDKIGAEARLVLDDGSTLTPMDGAHVVAIPKASGGPGDYAALQLHAHHVIGGTIATPSVKVQIQSGGASAAIEVASANALVNVMVIRP